MRTLSKWAKSARGGRQRTFAVRRVGQTGFYITSSCLCRRRALEVKGVAKAESIVVRIEVLAKI